MKTIISAMAMMVLLSTAASAKTSTFKIQMVQLHQTRMGGGACVIETNAQAYLTIRNCAIEGPRPHRHS